MTKKTSKETVAELAKEDALEPVVLDHKPQLRDWRKQPLTADEKRELLPEQLPLHDRITSLLTQAKALCESTGHWEHGRAAASIQDAIGWCEREQQTECP